MIVNFQDWASDEDVRDLLEKHSLEATRISQLRKKYAVDVPTCEEKKFVEVFSHDPLVKSALL
jgi:hypothetical protein